MARGSHSEKNNRDDVSTFLPMSRAEMDARGWRELDVLLIGGDAYVDHPSFGLAVIGRWLEHLGLKVGIVAQPRWKCIDDIARLGRPRLFVGITSGTVDSMLNHYTANRRLRSDDMYAPGGKGGLRPDYASIVYSQLARQAFPETPIIAGGVEVSLRRLAHYDYWQNRVRPSILVDLAADCTVFGMGEKTVSSIVTELKIAANAVRKPLSREMPEVVAAMERICGLRGVAWMGTREAARSIEPRLTLPSFEEVREEKKKFARAALLIEQEANPFRAKTLVQVHGGRAVVINPPALPLSTEEYDAIYALPFNKRPHPAYTEKIPAAEMIQTSIACTRGCSGGCSFCAITLHQGRHIQSRSEQSILKEAKDLTAHPDFKGYISDVGGPTANMWRVHCKDDKIRAVCGKLSCLFPEVCPHLQRDHGPQIQLLRKVRSLSGVKGVFVSSGIRYDLCFADQKNGRTYLREVIAHHVGGHLKVAPEHIDDEVLRLMRKPPVKQFEELLKLFEQESARVGKEQYVVPYFISGFPGCTEDQMRVVHDWLIKRNWKLQQVQGFIPTPMTLATAMYWTGIDPVSKEPIKVARDPIEKRKQQALLQPHKQLMQRYGKKNKRT